MAIALTGLALVKRCGWILPGRREIGGKGRESSLMRNILNLTVCRRHKVRVHGLLRPWLLIRHLWRSRLSLDGLGRRDLLHLGILLRRWCTLCHHHGRWRSLVWRVLWPALLGQVRRKTLRHLAWYHARVYPWLRGTLVRHTRICLAIRCCSDHLWSWDRSSVSIDCGIALGYWHWGVLRLRRM